MFMYLHRASWHFSATLTEGFSCFFLSCKTNARVKPAKTGHGPHSSKIFVLLYVLFVLCRSVYCSCVCVCVCVCKCVLYYCHRVATQLQLTNKSYHKFVLCLKVTQKKPHQVLLDLNSLSQSSRL